MVKVTGPMTSLAASGTLADTITFSTWKGRPYVRQHVTPANPRSGDQVSHRAMLAFLSNQWSGFSDGAKATWNEMSDQLIASNFNAFIHLNMKNWHNFLTPGKSPTLGRDHNPSTNIIKQASYEHNRIKLKIEGANVLWAWGIAIFAAEGLSVTPAIGNCILIRPDVTIAEHFEFWKPPKLATYTFDTITFSTDGAQLHIAGTKTAVPP